MRAVQGRVDPTMVQRTARWLLARRDGRGGYRLSGRALDSFGRASPEISAAYVTWSLAEAEQRGIEGELRHLAALASRSQDPYLIALSVGALAKARGAGDADAKRLARRLAALQQPDGPS